MGNCSDNSAGWVTPQKKRLYATTHKTTILYMIHFLESLASFSSLEWEGT